MSSLTIQGRLCFFFVGSLSFMCNENREMIRKCDTTNLARKGWGCEGRGGMGGGVMGIQAKTFFFSFTKKASYIESYGTDDTLRPLGLTQRTGSRRQRRRGLAAIFMFSIFMKEKSIGGSHSLLICIIIIIIFFFSVSSPHDVADGNALVVFFPSHRHGGCRPPVAAADGQTHHP
jgi:hypothetical protein